MTIVVDKVLEDQVAQGVNALVQTVAYNVKLVRGIDSEIKDLTSDIETFSARLIEASKNSWATDHHVLRVVVKKFRTVVNEAQDTIADYVALKGKHVDNVFSKSLDKIPFCGKIKDFASEIQSIRAKLAMIRQDHGQELLQLMTYKINEQNKGLLTLQVRLTVEKDNIFGFENDMKTIKGFIEAPDNFIVIPIVGITGSGKTIFASMIFEEQKCIPGNFNKCIWVNVSQGFDRKQKFIDIIYQITSRREDISMMTEEGLAREICELLKDEKYFVVLDDVRKKEDWDSFKVVFPTNLKGSRVLVTSPYGNVVDSNWKSHNLEKLSNEEGWLLLKNNIFGKEGCNDEVLENVGKEIANKCNGLPLALVAVGGMLRQRRNIVDWQRVAENPFLEINREGQIYRDRIKMTYNDLSDEKLKNCFLYFACFPIGHEIVVWKLIRLWIAEEFIPTIDEQGYALEAEVEAQKYLNDLVDRNLVMVEKRRRNGQIKTCCIHNTFHEFCKNEAARINLFHVVDEGQRLDDDENTSSSSTPHENISSTRRLCFHSFNDNKFDVLIKSYNQKGSLFPFGKHIHSLLLFPSQKGETSFTKAQLATIPNTFPLLRVLNIEFSIEFGDKFQPDELYNLHLLRYLAIKSNLNSLPKSFKNLRGLETLVIETTSRSLKIEEGIWNMEKLRHVRTNTSLQLPFPPKRSTTKAGRKDIIRTLSTISPASCTLLIFWNTPNLQKLGVRGDLSKFQQSGEISFPFEMLKCLENLKLYGQYDKVLTLPKSIVHAPKLKKLSFSGTLFEWKEMRVLGLLEELEVLKLDDYAFKGEDCDLGNKKIVFKRLQYLRIGRTNLVTWKATENSFPALRSLVLRNCSSLIKIPEAFANVHTLEVMELFHMSESTVQSANEVKEKLKNCGFQLQLLITSKMGKGPITAGTDTMTEEALNDLVGYVESSSEWNGAPRGLYSELKDVSLDIQTFNARLHEAYKNPIASVDVLMLKNFQTIVNEALDAASIYWVLKMASENKTFLRFLVPEYYRRSNVKSCASKIQSVRSKIERPTGYDKVIEEVEQAINMLEQSVGDNNNVNHIMKSEIEELTSLVKTFTENLVVACKNPQADEHRVLRVLLKKFRTLVNEARDAVANYFAQEKKNALAKAFHKIPLFGMLKVGSDEIQSIKEKVKAISENHKEDLRHLREDYNKRTDLPPHKVRAELRENEIVGFNDDLKIIETRLVEASKDLFVIPIVGNAGAGKTTFALKIFEDPKIRKNFTHCIWVHVSQGFCRKQKFIDILHQIFKPTEDFSTVLEDVLEAKIKELLEDQRYFIVLDNVQEKEDWDSFKVVFPINMKGSRVLITTRSGNVVESTWKSHGLGKLSNDDGWLLIKKNVFGTDGRFDTLIEEFGIKIAEKCNGLPHALVLVAGILRNSITSAGWQRVANNPLLSYHELVELSYNDLADENLKNCFLYFACFPMGHEIVAWKLICLWISEHFIPKKDEWGYDLDVEAEASKYLNVLVDRNLVLVKKRRADGQIKTCCIHDTLHDFCRSEAERKSLFHVVGEGQRLGASITLRRLCSYYTIDILDPLLHPSDSFFNLFIKRNGVISVSLSSSEKSEEIHLTPEQLEYILKHFPLLMVLNIESLKFKLLPNELYSQYFMRYLAITADISSLPKSLERLPWLQTLVIKTTERALQINGGIWNMKELRRVHTNTSTQLPSPPKTGKHSRKQTNICALSTISPGSCTSEIFNKTPKLQKLGVRGNLSELLEKKQNVCLFNNIQMLECLENLKLHGNSEKVELKVPMLDKFPKSLRKLTLSGTLFQWNDITVLGSLEQLVVLKLDDNAFLGKHWDLSSDVIFKRLQYLRIGKMNLITWTAVDSEKNFPVLQNLVFRTCISLENIPQDLVNVDSLKVMELFDVNERMFDFAREICVKRHGKTNVKINGFNLFITPVPSQATVHNQAYGNEHVKSIGFDHPSTSISLQEILQNQAYGDGNVNTSGLGQPSSSSSSQEIVHNQANENEHDKTNEFDHPSTSIPSQEIVHKQSHGEENGWSRQS
nr:putative late blight resistance protein homolog R1B-14 [Ipomoea batatas]